MVQASRAGIGADDFWNATPFEIRKLIEGYSERLRDHSNSAILGAYYSEVFARTKRLQSLDEYLLSGPEREDTRPFEVQQKEAVQNLFFWLRRERETMKADKDKKAAAPANAEPANG